MILLARMELTMNGIVGVVLDEPFEDSSYLYNKRGMTLVVHKALRRDICEIPHSTAI